MIYRCIKCGFVGSRQKVRKHLIDYHKMRCDKKNKKPNDKYHSIITASMERVNND